MREGTVYKRCTVCGDAMSGTPSRGPNKGRDRADIHAETCDNRTHSWAFVVDVAPPGAKRKQVTSAGHPTKGEAVAEMHKIQRAHEEGTAVERNNLTVRVYLESWLEMIKPPRSRRGRDPIRPGTWEEWNRRLRNYVIPHVGDIPLQALNEVHLEDLYRHLETAGKVRGGGGLARSTVHSIHLTLHAALEDALGRKPVPLVNRNVSDKLYSAPSTPDEEVEVWSPEELREFLASVKDDEHYALWRMAAMTGARRSELLALRWRNIDFKAGTVTINRGRVKGFDGEVTTGRTKSEKGRRTLDLDPSTLEALAAHRRAEQVANMDGYIFVYEDGKPLHPDGVTQRFEFRVRQSGVRRISLKGVRHTWFSIMLKDNPLHVVSRMGGHSDPAFTARVYAHFLPNQQAEAVAGFAAVVDG